MKASEDGRVADGQADLPPMHTGGFTLWFTGLSGAGKTTIGRLVGTELERRGRLVEYLDGDAVRAHLWNALTYSKEDRDTNVARIGWVASRLTRHGAAVVASVVSPYADMRRRARAMVEQHGRFVEIYVKATIEVCARRDVKGLYARAFAGELKGFTGIDDPYEEPSTPELVIETEAAEPRNSARQVLQRLVDMGVVSSDVLG
jgi:adenylylsulfate kinase